VKKAPCNKNDFFRRWMALEFGNRPHIWLSQKDLRASGWTKSVTARRRTGGECHYWITVTEALESRFAEFTFNEALPDDRLIIQGEVCHLGGHLHLFYSLATVPMLEALRTNGKNLDGVHAWHLMEAKMDTLGYDAVRELLDAYEEPCVVEFGTYSCSAGVIPGHRTLIWEVRAY
jgi:hypothetical protein